MSVQASNYRCHMPCSFDEWKALVKATYPHAVFEQSRVVPYWWYAVDKDIDDDDVGFYSETAGGRGWLL